MNSSHTWKSGEKCRVSGTYRCQNCNFMGRETRREFEEGAVLPMCDASPDKDATWHLIRPRAQAARA
jgi:hypothetical protein